MQTKPIVIPKQIVKQIPIGFGVSRKKCFWYLNQYFAYYTASAVGMPHAIL